MKLVLQAAGIPSQVERFTSGWTLLVESDSEISAVQELREYQQEREETRKTQATLPPVSLISIGSVLGCVLFCLITSLITRVAWNTAFGIDWESLGLSRAGEVAAGRWWLCVTALSLHADIPHLLSNLVFGVLFGLIVSQRLGAGIAWALILLSGFMGNLINALTRDPLHASLGASTAIFGALGLAVGLALWPSLQAEQRWMKRWSPLVAGVVLLSLYGAGGERTDVGAHFWGSAAGFLLGWLATWIPESWIQSTFGQWLLGCLALLLILCAWGIALSFAQAGDFTAK